MPDKKMSDAEFDAYLEGKSPLSDLYQRTGFDGGTDGGPRETIDNAILNAARQEAQKTTSGSSTSGYRWYVPVALAASLVIAIMVIRVGPFDNVSAPDQLASSEAPDISSQHVGSAKATPEIRLQKIDALVADGKKEQAQQEYELFIELFPKHEIDLKKYPNLKELTIN